MALPSKKKPGATDNNGSKDLLEFLRTNSSKVKKAMNKEAPTSKGYTTNEDIISAFKLKPEANVVVQCRVNSVRGGKDKNGNGYFSFNYTVTGPVGKGLTVSNFVSLAARGERTIDDAFETAVYEFQRIGYDTQGGDPETLVALCEEASKEKPACMVRINCYKGNSGLGVGVRAVRPIEEEEELEDESEEESEEDSDEDSEDSEEDSDESDDTDDSEDSDEGDDFDADDPSTWIGASVKAKPKGTTRPATYEITAYSKAKGLTVYDKAGKSYTISLDDVIDFAD